VVNAAAMPKALAWGLGALALLLILRALTVEVMAAQAARAMAGSTKRETASEEAAFSLRDHLKALGLAGFALAYVLLLPYLGYAVSVALVVGCVSLYIGAPRDWKIPAVAVGAAAVFYLIFVVVLGIPQPPGFWPSLLR
jgi:cell division protein FtsW (lipid II flippase)